MSDIQELEIELKLNQEAIDVRDAVLRLSENKDFIKIIHEDYLTKDVARLAIIGQDPNLDEKQQRDAQNMTFAAGHLKRFLSVKVLQGNTAANQVEKIREDLEELTRINEAGEE